MTTSTTAPPTKGRRAIWPGGVPKPLMPYSPIITAGGWVFLAGQLATDFETGVAPEARVKPGLPHYQDPLELQSRYMLGNIRDTLAAAGVDMATDVMRIYQWFVSPHPTLDELAAGSTWPEMSITPYLRVRDEFIPGKRPASTGMVCRELMVRDTIVEVDVIAFEPIPGQEKQAIGVPEGIPAPLAGYSPAVRWGDWVFLAGEIPVDWKGDYGSSVDMGEKSALAPEARVNPYLWYGSDVEAQTEYTLTKLAATAEAAGSRLENCVKATVYIGDPRDFGAMDRVWRRWFPENPPARVVIPQMGLGGKGSKVEIAMKLLTDDASITKETIETSDAPEPQVHEPQAVRAGNFLFFSSVLPADENGLAEETRRHPNFPWYGIPEVLQMEYMLKNIDAICSAAGTTVENICRRQAFHDDLATFQNSISRWGAAFPSDPPASTTMLVGPLQVPGAHLLLDLIGYVPDRD
ncbi:MAG: RidA family protein [Thermoleophilia bacterium]